MSRENSSATAATASTTAPTESQCAATRVPWWIDALGWIGSLTVLGAHAAVSLGRLDDGAASYAALNVVGSLALVVMCTRRAVWPAVCLNATWAVVAGVKLVALAV